MKSLVSKFWGLEWVLSKSGHEFTVPLLLPITPQMSAEAHNLVNLNFIYSLTPSISFGKMSLEKPRGRQKELKGPGTKQNLGWMHLWMIFCLILKSSGKAEDVSLHFMHPRRFLGELEGSSTHLLALHHPWSLSSSVQSWRGYSSLLTLHLRWYVLCSRLCIIPAVSEGIQQLPLNRHKRRHHLD